MTAILDALPWLTGLIFGLGVYAKGRADAKASRDAKDAREYQRTMERAANADTGDDLSDGERIKRLRQFSQP